MVEQEITIKGTGLELKIQKEWEIESSDRQTSPKLYEKPSINSYPAHVSVALGLCCAQVQLNMTLNNIMKQMVLIVKCTYFQLQK